MSDEVFFLKRRDFQLLLDKLREWDYQCVGPQLREKAIIFDTLTNVRELPVGITQKQAPGSYSLYTTGKSLYFSWANGPQSIKPWVFSPREMLWSVEKTRSGQIKFSNQLPQVSKTAIIGVRSCDLAALYLQDKHFLQGEFKDPYYTVRRQNLFLVAVNCTHPAETCFCASTHDGPRAKYGFDISLTELEDGFLVEGRSDQGHELLRAFSLEKANEEQISRGECLIDECVKKQTRTLSGTHLKTALFNQIDNAYWKTVSDRCLSCGNCTSVCPTCFCHSEIEVPSLDGRESQHFREWSSCFTQAHSYIHGITIRDETRLRYRQWILHKFGSWHEQYGRSGCVGCGRCITWCPVGIDVVETVNTLVKEESS